MFLRSASELRPGSAGAWDMMHDGTFTWQPSSFLSPARRNTASLHLTLLLPSPFYKTNDDGPQEHHEACRTIMSWGKILALASSCALFAQSALAVTVYGQTPLGATRTLQPDAKWTGLPAYDPTTLTPPVVSPLPSPYFLQLTNDVTAVGGVSIPMKSTFYGFSIEVSVVNQIREFVQRPSACRKERMN
jgi:hypothetical protein